MIRVIALAVWASGVALGAERGAIWFEARQEAARHAALRPAEVKTELRKAKPLSVPIARGGEMRGYVVMQLAYVVDPKKAAALGVNIEPYLLDEAFAALYADPDFDAARLESYDLEKFKTSVARRLNARLGAPAVRDVLIPEFNYVAVADLRR